MLILGCDTSSIASGALVRTDETARTGEPYRGPVEVLGTFTTEDTRSHAEVMAPAIREVLRGASVRGEDLDLILTGVGPGPFTGLRAGIMTARALGWAWHVPVSGVMSLDAVAHAAHHDLTAGSGFLVATDARRREVYGAAYRVTDSGYSREAGPAVARADELRAALGLTDRDTPLATAGRGAALYPEALPALPGHEADEPLAENLIRAALHRGLTSLSDSTSPLYLRESDARVPQARKKASQS